jgi:hypothetical protein
MDLAASLDSGVGWVEGDARLDPSGTVRVSHEPLGGGAAGCMELTDWLAAIHDGGRSAKIDLKEGGPVIEASLSAIARVGLRDEDLWFNAAVEIVEGERGFGRLGAAHPGARLSCPLDTLASYLIVAPPAHRIIDLLRVWGLNWLCFGLGATGVASLVPFLQERGWPINVWDVATARDLERGLDLQPDAITADLGAIASDVLVSSEWPGVAIPHGSDRVQAL